MLALLAPGDARKATGPEQNTAKSMIATALLLLIPLLDAVAVTSTPRWCPSAARISTRTRCSPALMYEEEALARKVVELRASWQKSAPAGKPEPPESQFVAWAEEHLTEEERGQKVLNSLAAQIAADDAKAAEYWNSPEMVAAREAKAAKRAAAEKS